MTTKELEEILTRDIPEEMIEGIDQQVEQNINFFLKAKNIKYVRDIEIVFLNRYNRLTDPKYLNNACAKKSGLNKYQIYICPHLITDLFRFAHYIAGYKGFRLENIENDRHTFAQHLMYSWLYFISLHEYAHIILGHIDYNSSTASTLYEFMDLESLSDDKLIISQGMEFEADATAAILFFSSFMETKDGIKNSYKYSYTDSDLIFDNLLGLNFLCYFFEIRAGGKINGTHPLGKERATFFNGSILHNKEKLNKIINIKDFDLDLLNSLAYIEYMQFCGITKENEIIENLKSFLQKMNLFDESKVLELFKPYRLIK